MSHEMYGGSAALSSPKPSPWGGFSKQLAEWTFRWLVNRRDAWGAYNAIVRRKERGCRHDSARACCNDRAAHERR
jgi:hypothetical protein